MEQKLLTSKETANYLCVSESTLARWRREGHGPTYSKFLGIIRYKKSDVDQFIEEYKNV